ncbi:hypothetical protein CcI49_04795 [Frankia sp. CcI49]|uniref:MFS transporter n=1 Tax=Frankia sp. CcI49 TaxID=1745382 RepID=UPI0009771399|nr:MFS transporter [Frankia sp. CcI49]ONH61550.1 hypothetical protein CcI49_04795 [Frankia sp. CcI49]
MRPALPFVHPAPSFVRRAAGHRADLGRPAHIQRVRWLVLVVLCANLALIALDATILNVALPTLRAPGADGGLSASVRQLQWINEGYIIVFAGLLLTTGSLGDRFGRARLLTCGLAAFAAGSLLSALASSPDQLVAGRCVMGLGAALIMPATLSILSNVFTDDRERRVAVGIWSGVSAIGSVSGPIVGGLLLSRFWWGSVFLVNLPIVAVVLVLVFLYVPESRDPSARRLDPLGAALSILTLVALLFAIIEAPTHGWLSPAVLAAFAVSAVLLIAFIAWEFRTGAPMLDLGFFRDPRFSVASLAIALTFFGMYGTSFILTQYLQEVLGLTPLGAGTLVAPQAVVFFLVATRVATPLAERAGARAVITAGLGALSVFFAALALCDSGTSLGVVVAITCGVGVGMGLTLGPATSSIMSSVPRERAGVGSAMNDTTRQVGGALGVAVLGTILSSRRTDDESVTTVASTPSLSGLHAAALTAGIVVACAIPLVARYLPARQRAHPRTHLMRDAHGQSSAE